mgnify:CR=1 FL=1
MYKKPYIIAEAGCNHMGQMEIAKDLIETAAHFCKADQMSEALPERTSDTGTI